MLGCKSADKAMGYNSKPRAKMIVYNSIDGVSVNSFVTHITKLDISFVVSMVSQIMNNPTEEHMESV